LLDQKVTKNQGFREIRCGSNQEVFSRNTRHESFEQGMAFVVAVYCYAHAIHTYLLQEPLTYFSEAGPYLENFTFDNQTKQCLAFLCNFFLGYGDRPIRNSSSNCTITKHNKILSCPFNKQIFQT
jgi:hypothetical protein